jgi:hypothetical protein
VKYGSVCATAEHLAVLAAIDLGGEPLTAAEQVAVDVAAVEHEILALGITDTARDHRRGTLFHGELDIHLVFAARHAAGLVLHFLDVRQFLQPLLGALQRHVGQRAAFELAQFAAQDVIARALHPANSMRRT